MVLMQTTNTSAIVNNGISIEFNGLDAAENISLAFNETGDKLVLNFSVPTGEMTEPEEQEPEEQEPETEQPADETEADETLGETETEESADNSAESSSESSGGSSGGGAINFGFLLALSSLLMLRRKTQDK